VGLVQSLPSFRRGRKDSPKNEGRMYNNNSMPRTLPFEELVLDIAMKATWATRLPFLAGISGFGGSGKSTLATRLAIALPSARWLSIDNFWRPDLDIIAPDGEYPCFDRERLRHQVLEPARSGQPVHYQCLDDREKDYEVWRTVPECQVLIVEGCTLFHPTLRGYFDAKIWVDCPLEIATARGIARDNAQFGNGVDMTAHWKEKWEPNERYFLAKHQPEKCADWQYRSE
jgi:uridine kinase